MQLGIRLHDVNASLPESEQTLEKRAQKAREEGFSCVHLALSKCIPGFTFDNAALTEGLAAHVHRVFQRALENAPPSAVVRMVMVFVMMIARL